MTTTLERASLAIGEDAAAALFFDAHTTYRFTDEPVSDAELASIYELAKLAPTALNSQPLRVAYLRDDAKARLIPHLAEGNRAKSESAPVVAVLAYDADFHEHMELLNPRFPNAKAAFADEAGRHAFAQAQASIQLGYFILAARAVGLDAGPMTGLDMAGVDAEFFSDSTWHTFAVVNLGHAAEGGTYPRNPRLDQDTAVIYA